MGMIFASLRLSGKQPVSMDLFLPLVNILNVNSLFLIFGLVFHLPQIYYFHISNNCFTLIHKNCLKRETASTVEFYFDVLDAGVVFVTFDDIINPV